MGWPASLSPSSAWFSRTFSLVRHRAESPSSSWGLWAGGSIAVLASIALAGLEMRSSWAESRILAAASAKLSFTVAAGSTSHIDYPDAGPYDRRLGYAMLPVWLDRLDRAGYFVKAQARLSGWALRLSRFGVSPIYHEKDQAGIKIIDQEGAPLYSFSYPARIYPDFDSIPPAVVQTLLFIENRRLLDPAEPFQNPAIEWGRLGRAALDFSLHKLDRRHSVIGGSTLATQLEKLHHSPAGRTHSPSEKLRQIVSATLRAYQDGPRTLEAQRVVIRDYINSIPLAATPGHGEVTGLGDGL